ncbi:HAD hydrolase-like protein [Deinococcus radiomollis]|uniref:HAD family hydrolase n=1 Tax=Deinococcus radiomollis TaxID=468916 RepID=UPI00389134AB
MLPLFAFDMDGVLFDSEEVKIWCFRAAFEPLGLPSEHLAAIDAANRSQRGIPREQKIRLLLGEFAAHLPPHAAYTEVTERYRHLLEQELPRCPPLPGLRGFLTSVPASRHVCSSAPAEEIRSNLRRHTLTAFFDSVNGYPDSKATTLDRLRRLGPVIFFGDAPADLEAARQTGTTFVAVNPSVHLKSQVPEWLEDFTDVPKVRRLAGLNIV